MEPAPGVRVVVAAECSVGDVLQISIRPEKISIVAGDDAAEPNRSPASSVTGIAVERVYLGSVSQPSSSCPAASASPSTSSTTIAPRRSSRAIS